MIRNQKRVALSRKTKHGNYLNRVTGVLWKMRNWRSSKGPWKTIPSYHLLGAFNRYRKAELPMLFGEWGDPAMWGDPKDREINTKVIRSSRMRVS